MLPFSVKEVKLIEPPYHGLIGRGKFEVYKCLVDGEVKALKLLEHSGSKEEIEKTKKALRNEVVSLTKAQPSPYVVHLTGLVEYQYCSGIIMEYMPRGNLSDFLQKYSPSLSLRLKVLHDIAEGIKYLHSDISTYEAVSHNDLKPHNIVICEDFTAKICDFGGSDVISRTSGPANYKIKRTISCFTENYAPPELAEVIWTQGTTIERSRSMDVYSFSMIMYFVLTGIHPFGNLESGLVITKCMNGERPKVPDPPESADETALRHGVENLMKECWHQSPANRPNIQRVFNKLKAFKNKIDQEQLREEIASLRRDYPTPPVDPEEYRITFDTFCQQNMRHSFQDADDSVERTLTEHETELPGGSCKASVGGETSEAISVVNVMIEVRHLGPDLRVGESVVIKSPTKIIKCQITEVGNISAAN